MEDSLFTDDEALDMAVRSRLAEPAALSLECLIRIINRLPPYNRPLWVLQRLAAATRAKSCAKLTRGEMTDLLQRMLGKSGKALDDAISQYAAAVERGDKSAQGKAGNPTAQQ